MMEYMAELREGGYPLNWRMEVLSSAVKGYQRIWSMESEGTGHVNRPGWVTQNKRRAENLIGKSTWFMVKDKPQNQSSNLGTKKPVRRLQKPR